MEILNPTVSVLLPVKSWRPTTRQAVCSVLSQTIRSFEVLLIGQADVEQLMEQLPADPRIRPVSRQAPGITGALNTGLKLARGQFIARMDDDDVSYPQRFETQLNYLERNKGIDLCAARVRFIDRNGSPDGVADGNRRYAQWLNSLVDAQAISHSCYIECPMPHPTLMAHRSVWERLQGYRTFDGPEDYDLVLRAKLQGIAMGKPDAVLLDWREHEHRLTHTNKRYRPDAFTRCRAWAACQPDSALGLNEGRDVWICGTGKSARQWHDALNDLDITVQGFVDIEKAGVQLSLRSKRGKPIVSYAQLPAVRDNSLIITALSQPAAREQLETYFAQLGWFPDQDYILGG